MSVASHALVKQFYVSHSCIVVARKPHRFQGEATFKRGDLYGVASVGQSLDEWSLVNGTFWVSLWKNVYDKGEEMR